MLEEIILSENEVFDVIYRGASVKIERIISNGHKSPNGFWYDQDEYEFVIILEGYAVLEFDDGKIEMGKNDYVIIEPHKRHRILYTEKSTVWLCVFFK